MFSVVIPVYNHAEYLRDAVTSAVCSDLVKEVLLCDDGSSDESSDLCAMLACEYPSLVYNYSENPSRNRGAHYRLNELCKISRQPWIRILNSDDFYLTGSFETIKNLVANHRASFISGSMLICDEKSQIKGTKRGLFDPEYTLPFEPEAKPVLHNDEVSRFLLNQNFISTTSNMAFSRDLFDRIGGFRDFRYVHDLDFALRATICGRVIHTASYLVTYRTHSSNTISENSPHMDGEFVRLYSRLLNEYPDLEKKQEALQLLQHNRHLKPFPKNPRIYQKDRAIIATTDECKFSETFPPYARPNALLALSALNYNFVIITDTLEEPEWPLGENIKGFFTHGGVHKTDPNLLIKSQNLRGIIIRCPGSALADGDDLSQYHNQNLRLDGATVLKGNPPALQKIINSSIRDQLCNELKAKAGDSRPVVYVMPIFLAVGGAERNMIEVIRSLKDKYRFVVITTERLSKSQGSLHWQIYEMDIPVFDLAEIADHKYHFYLLWILAEVVAPDLLWICNGSPWIVENAVRMRRLFADIPIIDQEVYDTEEGWINHYHQKGIQSYDNFIAINSKINTVFQKHLGIPAHRISHIYHILSDDKVRKARDRIKDRECLKVELGIPNHYKKLFIFVGRLSDQKKPLEFLKIARYGQVAHKDCFFLMVGDGDLSNDCEKFIEDESLSNIKRISYYAYPPDLMALADGLIITSIYEGLPIVMLEALGVGIPVLATDVGDIGLVLEKYNSGKVFRNINLSENPKNAKSDFSDFIGKLHFYQAKAERNSNEICSEFGKENISSKYYSLFEAEIQNADYEKKFVFKSEDSRE